LRASCAKVSRPYSAPKGVAAFSVVVDFMVIIVRERIVPAHQVGWRCFVSWMCSLGTPGWC
jgi:hypothetical protein